MWVKVFRTLASGKVRYLVVKISIFENDFPHFLQICLDFLVLFLYRGIVLVDLPP